MNTKNRNVGHVCINDENNNYDAISIKIYEHGSHSIEIETFSPEKSSTVELMLDTDILTSEKLREIAKMFNDAADKMDDHYGVGNPVPA